MLKTKFSGHKKFGV